MQIERPDDACFGVIKAARQRLKALPESRGSTATIKDYEIEFNRLVGESAARDHKDLWASACKTDSKRTYYRRRAALKHVLRRQLQETLARQDQFQRAGDAAAWYEEVGYLEGLIELANVIEDAKGQCPIAAPKPRHSKRQDLRGLPADWRERMLKGMSASKYRVPYLVAALSGCRPEELQNGVAVRLIDEKIELTVVGAKVKGTQGQPMRTVTYAREGHPLVDELAKFLRERAVASATISVESKVAFTSAIRRLGRKLWPGRKSEITPYCLRHQAAADWKAYLDGDQVSAALGHAVDATASNYGQAQMSRGGGLRPEHVLAERAIKPTRTDLGHIVAKTPERSRR